MARQLQLNETPDRIALDPGHYLFSIQKIQEIQDQQRPGQLIYLGTFICEEPPECEGMAHSERYMIGTEEDPDAMQASTWKRSMGASNLKKLLKAAQVPDLPDDDALFAAAKNSRFVARIAKDKTGEYSNIKGYFTVTSPEAAKVGQTESAGTPATPNGAPAQAGQATMDCNVCGAKVSRAEWGKHLMTHRPKPDEATPVANGQAEAQ